MRHVTRTSSAFPRPFLALCAAITIVICISPAAALGQAGAPRGPELLSATLVPAPDDGSGAQLAVRWNGEPEAALTLTVVHRDGTASVVLTDQPLRAGVNLLRLPVDGESRGTLRLRVYDAAGVVLATREEGLPELRSSSGFAWKPTFVSGGPDGPVAAAVVWDDGSGPSLVVGGSFSTIGRHVVNGLARWDGFEWSPLVGSTGAGIALDGGRGWVGALAVYEGALIAGGHFAFAGDELVFNIARWDGATWSSLEGASGVGVSGSREQVRALAVHDGALYVGGDFLYAGGIIAQNIARWDGSDWSVLRGPLATGTIAEVMALAVYDGELIAGGRFHEAGGVAVSGIARWDGNAWAALSGPTGTGVHGEVFALAEYQGTLIVGGGFHRAGGIDALGVARWNGSGWSSLSGTSGLGAPGRVFSLATYQGDLIVGGHFEQAGGIVVDNVARWNGSQWTPLGTSSAPGTGGAQGSWGADVDVLTVFDGDLIVGGRFTQAGGAAADHIARWDGSSWAALPEPLASMRLDGGVWALTIYGGDLVAGGDFTHAGGVLVNRVARWDGRRWWPFAGPSGAGLDGPVYLLGIHQGDLIAGGSFHHAGGVEVNGIARWNGARWVALSSSEEGGLRLQAPPIALATFQGDLVVGGDFFSQANGFDFASIARWDGQRWSALVGSDGTRIGGSVRALAIYQGELLVAGHLQRVGDVTSIGLARWNGSDWSLFTGSGAPSWVEAIEVYRGDLVAAGDFVPEWGVPANSLARWDGSKWHPVAGPSGRGIESGVVALATYEDSIIAAGWFERAGMEWVHNIARWGGGEWEPLSGPSGAGTDGRIAALAVYGQDLVAAGTFLSTGGVPNRFIGLYGPGDCVPGPTTLCIDDQPGDRRFEVRMDYQTVQAGGLSGQGRAIPLAGLGVSRGGLFYFLNPTNPEMLLKVLDGCTVNGRRWVFFSAGTNLGFVVRVRDTQTGQVVTFHNADLNAALPIQDTSAFACSTEPAGKNASAEASFGDLEASGGMDASGDGVGRSGEACAGGQDALCIAGRFEVGIEYQTTQAGGLSGKAQAIPLSSIGVHRGGLFYFVNPTNPEVLIKVLDGCAINDHYWVFYSAGTNLGLQVKVRDTVTGHQVEYTNPDLTAALPIQDTSALPCS